MSCHPSRWTAWILLAAVLPACCGTRETATHPALESTPSLYSSVPVPHPDGIGRLYMGREIARVMGHQGADWLERASRPEEERSDLLLTLLEVKKGDVVADIGAGSGYFTRPLARQVGPQGTVWAVDVQPEMLALLTNKLAGQNLTNVQAVLGTETNPRLPPECIDLVLMVDVYHEMSHPFEMMQAICRSLKPKGRVVLVEYKAEDPTVPIKALHKMSEAQVKREMALLPLEYIETKDQLPWQHVLVFRKTSGP